MTERAQTVAELAIVRSRAGAITPQAALWAVAASVLVVPNSNPEADGSLATFSPVLVGREGVQFLVAFTLPERAGRFRESAASFFEMTGADLVLRLPAETGLVLNPDSAIGFELPPAGLAALKTELSS